MKIKKETDTKLENELDKMLDKLNQEEGDDLELIKNMRNIILPTEDE